MDIHLPDGFEMEVARALRLHAEALSITREALEDVRCPGCECPTSARLSETIHHLRTLSLVIQAECEMGETNEQCRRDQEQTHPMDRGAQRI